jgi:CheY-like chemotaxis protein/anti-sigma regulatory factor (Ser/Thr protein kinase)
VEDILNIAKLDAGEYEFEDQQMSLPETIRDIVALYRVPAQAKGVTLETVVEPSIPEPIIGDRERLKQILGNLVSNAVKYTDEGAVTIHAAVERTAPWMLAITVRDTGIGIALEDQPRLFKLFEQLDSSYAKRHSGTGLGLAITKRLVESTGGSIHFESSPGIGTAFTVRLPLILPLEVENTAVAKTTTEIRDTSSARPSEASQPVRRPRVLLAEDEPINAAILTRSLESIDAVVAHAENGQEVLDQLGAFRPDIIIMDAQMPEMSGVEATWRIRSLPSPQADVPIVGLTAYSHERDIQALLDAGMDECHTKPIELAVLQETLYRHLPGLFKQQVG